MAAKRKTVAKKTVAKKVPSSKKFYMYGDVTSYCYDSDKVCIALPVQLLTDLCTASIAARAEDDETGAAEAAEKEMERIKKIIAKKTSEAAAQIVGYTATYDDDAKSILKAIKKNKGVGTGESESVAGWGPTRKIARAEYDAMQDDESFEEFDW